MADKADPFTKQRLLDLAQTYDARLGRIARSPTKLPSVAINSRHHADHRDREYARALALIPKTDVEFRFKLGTALNT
jgi:hypothetical protein